MIDRAVEWAAERHRRNAGRYRVGLFARFERMAKWNEALRFEPALGINT